MNSFLIKAGKLPQLLLIHHNLMWDHNLILIFYDTIGAYGEVRKCLNKGSKALRAVKIINKMTLGEQDKEKLLNEIEILKTLDHPNILKLYEFFQDQKRYFLVTE